MQRPSRKTVSLIFLGAASVSWLFFQHLVSFVWVVSGISFGRNWMVPLPMLVAIGLSALLFVILWKNEKATTFIEDVIVELSKVAWPARKETVLSAGVVSVLVGICAVILFFFDVIWGALVKMFYQ